MYKKYSKKKYTRKQAYEAFEKFAKENSNFGENGVVVCSMGQSETPKTYGFHYVFGPAADVI